MPKRDLSPDAKASTPKKTKIYKTNYNSNWAKTYTWVSKSAKDCHHAYCSACKIDFSISHSGEFDVKQHAKGSKHQAAMDSTQSTKKMNDFFKVQSDNSVTKAEVLFTNFVAEHNLPFLVADHFTDFMKAMFPDSDIARKFGCKRTKTTNILNNALGPHFDQIVTDMCREQKFSVMLDESNDKGGEKVMAVLVRLYDVNQKKIDTKFLGLPICNIGTGENLFNTLNQIFVDRAIPWTNCVSYMSDNASVMVGKNNSVLSRVREQNPMVYSLGCVCHLANLCAKAGIESIPHPVEDLLIDVYFHFHHSAKRKEEYKEFLDFTDTDPLKILKHCSTRWLSLKKCIGRLLQQWPALKSYFESHEECERGGRVQRCMERLSSQDMYLHYLFLDFILPVLDEFNTTFQAESALIGHLHGELTRLFRRFLGKFVKTSVISRHTDILSVDFKSSANQHEDSNLAVGLKTREYLKTQESDLTPETISKFYRNVRGFYIAVVEKMVKKFPLKDTTLQALAFLCPESREKISPDQVTGLAQRFEPQMEHQAVQEEAEEYLLSPTSDLPEFHPETTKLDDFWVRMYEKKLPSGKLQYPMISRLALTLLTIPNSNAECERIFSQIRKIQTDQRGNLANATIQNLLSLKVNNQAKCFEFNPTPEILKKAKSASS